jgi:membrane-bound lytic murein transglycosylase MltF
LFGLASSTWSASSLPIKAQQPTGGVRLEFTDAYDDIITEKVDEYWLDLDEPLLAKAQMYQESNLNPKVCSSVGACGFGQFMPGTWQDAIKYMHWSPDLSRFDVEDGIEAFVWYQGRQRYMWRNGRSPVDANELGQANYNAGPAHILKAQKLCNNASNWNDIVPTCLPQITGQENAKQTIDYTIHIRKWWCLMQGESKC